MTGQLKEILTADKANGEQVKLSNVLVFEAVHQTIDNAGRQAIDIESGGKGLLFQAGFVKEIEWKNIDGILTPIENGVPVQLVPGKTWIHIVPTKPGMANLQLLILLEEYVQRGEKQCKSIKSAVIRRISYLKRYLN